MRVINDTPTRFFVTCEFELQTMQAERITMERVAKVTRVLNSHAEHKHDQLTKPHLTAPHSTTAQHVTAPNRTAGQGE